MISLEKLSNIYNCWGDKEKLQPLSSADEEICRDDITEKQRLWLEKFIDLWNETEKKERIKNEATV